MIVRPLVVLAGLAGALGAVPAQAEQGYGKVSVAGVSITGLSKAKAIQRLQRELRPRLRVRVHLTDGKTAVYTSRASLGAQLDIAGMLANADRGATWIPLQLRCDLIPLQRSVHRLAPQFHRATADARPVLFRGRVILRPEQPGRELNLGAAVWRAKQQLEANPTNLVRLPVRLHAPRRTRAQLQGINGVLGSFTTRFRASQIKRTGNMMIAINSIDGTLIPAGKVYSQNHAVGARTQARGYRTAIIFKNGYKVAGIGGGVSQVTGTLFNAALLSGLPIVTYRTHSRPVTYLPIGRDATVAWGSFDMKFRNNTGAPIYIDYRRTGSRITATLFGHKIYQRVKLHVSSQKLGLRHIKAELFRVIARPGGVIKERVGRSEYKWNEGDWEP